MPKSSRGPIRFLTIGTLAFSCFAFAQQPPSNDGWRRLGDSNPYPADQAAPPRSTQSVNVPPVLILRPGAYITVRVDQPLSSDHNQQGDAFSATLVKPVVVDGIVVADRGQT